ncbi:MAG: hypothetical protein E6I96_06160 [Chloroflexi bacterium]|nr:MAG: hypothetical protein E6I96_06160 [Chloroflexota bacterium]
MPDHDPAVEPPAASLGLGSRALRNTVMVLTAKVVARMVALVTVLYMVRWLGPPHYGSFSVLVNLTAITSVMLDLGHAQRHVAATAHVCHRIPLARRAGHSHWSWRPAAAWFRPDGLDLVLVAAAQRPLRRAAARL